VRRFTWSYAKLLLNDIGVALLELYL
jgi:hypothetical protein